MIHFILDFFKYSAEWLLVASRVVMIRKVFSTKSVSGLSLKTHLCYLITYSLRYLHLRHWFRYSWSVIYSNILKTIFLGYQLVICYCIIFKYRKTYYRRHDNFPISVLLVVSVLLGLVVSRNIYWHYYEELCYNISLILESIAILPQLVMTQEAEDCEIMTSRYILMLGIYRFCYLMHFIARKYLGGYVDTLMIVTAIVQTGLYIDFFLVYYSYVFRNKDSGINIEKKSMESESYTKRI
ncbi:hypothetical protein NUSPORA_02837 [Nucleospora cyclopteri]